MTPAPLTFKLKQAACVPHAKIIAANATATTSAQGDYMTRTRATMTMATHDYSDNYHNAGDYAINTTRETTTGTMATKDLNDYNHYYDSVHEYDGDKRRSQNDLGDYKNKSYQSYETPQAVKYNHSHLCKYALHDYNYNNDYDYDYGCRRNHDSP